MLFVRGIWRTLGLCSRKVVENFKQGLMVHPSRDMEDNAEGSVNCRVPAQEVSEGKDITSKWPKDHSCNILAKNGATFCSFPKSLPGAKLKSFWINGVCRGGFKTASVDSVLWLLVITLMQTYHEKQAG